LFHDADYVQLLAHLDIRPRDEEPMNKPAIFTDRKARESFKDKFEVVMAVIVIGSFIHKKVKQHQEETLEKLEQE
jgi:hypothetical protein